MLIALGVISAGQSGPLGSAALLRYWPVLLIGAGVYMLYNRCSAAKGPRP